MPTNAVHPDLRRIHRVLPTNPVSARTVPLLRAATKLVALRAVKGVETIAVSAHATVRVHRPPASTASVDDTAGAALLWIHGGGYVIGSAVQDDLICARFASELGITVAAVDYRLAPENPFPAPLDDCLAALSWLAAQPTVNADAIAVGGASAGGGLAAALIARAHDIGDIRPAFGLLVYPMLDDRTTSPETSAVRNHRLWSGRSNVYGWSSYLGDTDPVSAVPARRADLTGLPPTWIGVGDHDLFHDEDLVYAQRLRDAGVACETNVVPGAFHGFDALAPRAAVSREFFAAQCAALRAAFP
ncbi:alpha/beta hydrolase [Williamsia sp.]|uniref:alpha/beta hydrolase n=1 Tax=Williamsia sp. TaxID=1872085 RepID=UPI001A26F78B|nr:alpha/beta hydrolase [Williamsia sp.]MBJ7291395.1 alpha/beta hydrolase [Williamsia sp.]